MAEKGKNKRRQLEVYDEFHGVNLSVDSQEEVDFVNWCSEACKLSVLDDYRYQPDSFRLFEAVKYIDLVGKERSLFREHVYSPDALVMFDGQKWPELAKEFKVTQDQLSAQCSVWLDVKGEFARNDGGRSFSLNQKWTFQKFGIYIFKLVPKMFCKKFGCALKSFLTAKTKKARKMFSGYPTIKEAFKLK